MTAFDLLLRGGTLIDGTGSAGRPADVGILGDRIPQARIEHIPNVDHVLNMRAPEAFNHIVLGFLDEV